jgi:hypothetical protein
MRISLLILPLSCAVLAMAAMVAYTSGGSASSVAPQPAGHSSVAQAGTVTEHLLLNPTDFINRNPNCGTKIGEPPIGIFGVASPSQCQNWIANIHIPDGSIIRNFKVTYQESDQFANIFADLFVSNLEGGGISSSMSTQLPDAGGQTVTNMITNPDEIPVDNYNFHYDLRFTLDTDSPRVYSVVIEYDRPADSGGGPVNVIGDADCSGAVDTLDDLALLKHQAGFADNPSCPIG